MSGYVGLVGADGITPLFTATNPGQIALTGSGATAANVQGAFPHNNASGPGNPLQNGLFSNATAGGPGPYSAGRTVYAVGDLAGRQVVTLFGNPESSEAAPGLALVTGGAVVVAFAASASIRHEVASWSVFNPDNAAHFVDLKDGVTVLDTIRCPAGQDVQHTFPPGLPGTANTALNVVVRDTPTTACEAVVQAYKTMA